ncbi:MAG: hypothetical protein M0Z66_09925 [Thermaerobacter sp.]|nr:hypothetical protein [Thermaerobacter sp.]
MAAYKNSIIKLMRSYTFWVLIGADIVVVLPLIAWFDYAGSLAVTSANGSTMQVVSDVGQVVLYPLSIAMAAIAVALPLDNGRVATVPRHLLAAMGMVWIQLFAFLLVGWIVLTITELVGGAAFAGVAAGVAMLIVSVWSGMAVAETARSGFQGTFRTVNARFRAGFWAWLIPGLVITLSGVVLNRILPSSGSVGGWALRIPLVWMMAWYSLVTAVRAAHE